MTLNEKQMLNNQPASGIRIFEEHNKTRQSKQSLSPASSSLKNSRSNKHTGVSQVPATGVSDPSTANLAPTMHLQEQRKSPKLKQESF